jgi:hypothetical protein
MPVLLGCYSLDLPPCPVKYDMQFCGALLFLYVALVATTVPDRNHWLGALEAAGALNLFIPIFTIAHRAMRGNTFSMNKKLSRVEEVFGNPIAWGPWQNTVLPIMQLALLALKNGRLTAPVEVLFKSAANEELLHYRLAASQPKAWERLDSREA